MVNFTVTCHRLTWSTWVLQRPAGDIGRYDVDYSFCLFQIFACGISLSGSFRHEEWLPIHYLGGKGGGFRDCIWIYYHNGSYCTSQRADVGSCLLRHLSVLITHLVMGEVTALGVSGLIRPTVTQAKTVLIAWLQQPLPLARQACWHVIGHLSLVLAQTLYLMVFEIPEFLQQMVTSIFHIDLHSCCRIFPQGDLAFNLPPRYCS